VPAASSIAADEAPAPTENIQTMQTTKPVLIGPVTLLLLSKSHEPDGFDPLSLLDGLVELYREILLRLAGEGVEWVQIDEPVLATDLTLRQRAALAGAYERFAAMVPQLKLIVATYFGELRDNLVTFANLPVAGVHFDEGNAVNAKAQTARRESARIHDAAVQRRIAAIVPSDHKRACASPDRKKKQQARFNLPLLPTTTIGSFPQTNEVRAARARFRKGETDAAAYETFLESETRKCIEFQERAGLDMLVHGEFERTDMVEYFGEQLAGFAFTENGWVQSYGSRCVRPPIIYGDVSRPVPMTVRWSNYARSLTSFVHIEQIQDMVEETLIELGQAKVALAYG
jgi:methionine synthase II (cobalamin-independent)